MTFDPLLSVKVVSHSRVCGRTLGFREKGTHVAALYRSIIGASDTGPPQATVQEAPAVARTILHTDLVTFAHPA
jgi:hypothetical protein